MGKLFPIIGDHEFIELEGVDPFAGPDIYNSIAMGGSRAIYPRVTGSNPGTRECLEGWSPGYSRIRQKVAGILVYCGDNASKTVLKARFAITGRDGMFYTNTPGVDTGLPLDVIDGLTMAAGVSSTDAILAANGVSTGRWMRFNFDYAGVIPAATPFMVRCLAECEYTVTDSATLWASNFGSIGGAIQWPHAEGGAGLTGASYRPMLGVALRTGGIDTILDSAMASPGTAGVQALLSGSSTTISAKTVDIGTVNGFTYWLIKERIA